ncbi:hypothetical protein D7Y27_35120 [Corallococcus sp. AB004]|uniref:hypothetical protein n=1 Tax=Corallococcus exiguus TaxID=83462 RepID=UPI000EA26415|nr:hypothetical protein [Corallococcus exiguus]NPC76394.1 hypothetical protein [Corallococcus exiguus]NPD28861.1 hypothetical protein [Corallococcus exiguus]NRD51113.1 hypothetical protein [Corallococcus exiguus]RKI33119.1 hypothetical protein D7Y27_35120 [Corallococcus sp. AB004]
MPHHSSRGLSGLVPSWLRSLTVSSFALGGLLAAAPAHAADPQEVRPNIATVLDVALVDGELTASILWTDRQDDLPRSAKLVSYDGKDTATAGVNVTPKPGEISQVKVFGALARPWETGWAQKLVLEDPQGQPLATQPYDVNLDCATDKECSLTVSKGVTSEKDVVHVSSELDAVLSELDAKYGQGEYDLVKEVSKDFPHLRGEAMVYVQQWYWWYPLSGPCTCGWTTTTTRTPTTTQSILVSASGRSIYGWNGPGAKHTLSANAIPTGPLLNRTVTGTSQLSLGLRCSRRVYIYWWDFIIHGPGGWFPVRFPFPVSIPCTSPCQARFDHTGRVTGRTSISGVATAREAGTWRVNGGTPYINQLITGNNAFDADAIAVSFSNTSAYNTVSTSGQVTIPSTSTFASALVTNGYAQAIHGQLTCPQIPALAGRTVSDYGTTQGTSHQLSLFWFLQDFAAGF